MRCARYNRGMARLHLDVDELAREIDLALAHIARGGEVLLERGGHVVARLAPVGEGAGPAGGALPFDPAALIASFDQVDTSAAATPNPFAAMAARGHAGGPAQALAEGWDELSREEEFLELLAGELDE